jgi:hypothetical protein
MLAKFQIKQGTKGVAYHNVEDMFQADFILRNFAYLTDLDVHLLQTKTSALELAVPSHSIQPQFFTFINIHIGKLLL